MSLEKRRYSVLLQCTDEKLEERLERALPPESFAPAVLSRGAEESANLLAERPFDILIVCSPECEQKSLLLAAEAAAGTSSGVLLIVNDENFDRAADATENNGVMTASADSSDAALAQILRLLGAMHMKLELLATKASSLQMKLDDMRLVSRAKLLLMRHLKMSESEAHRYIEKSAMDGGLKRREVAENIIRTYED